MKRKFNIDDFSHGTYVMHCNTKEKAVVFLKYLDSIGRKWRNGVSYLAANEWDDYGDATVYYFNMGMYSSYNSVSSSHIILEFDAFDWSERQPLKGSDLLQLLESEGITGGVKRCLI